MLLMIDNYDSFTFNLVQYFGELGQEVRVFRNDQITLEGIEALAPDQLVLSPGPCSPAEAGICVPAVRHFAGRLPILGVCLGHQSIGAALGVKLVRAQRQMHGKTSVIERGTTRSITPVDYRVVTIDVTFSKSASADPADRPVKQTAETLLAELKAEQIPPETQSALVAQLAQACGRTPQ